MNKSYRQGQILNVIRGRQIFTQEELAEELAKLGVPATQVTLSRDIRELGLVKTAEGYRPIRTEPVETHVGAIVGEYLRDIRMAQNLLVLRTPPGTANALAVALDNQSWPEVVGTIAGDDTVLVITPDAETAPLLRARLLRMVER
ncbi:MAG: ArgR family transcriptional regulator [Bryobacteraceae bacterium]